MRFSGEGEIYKPLIWKYDSAQDAEALAIDFRALQS
jgi:hypothetical protein